MLEKVDKCIKRNNISAGLYLFKAFLLYSAEI